MCSCIREDRSVCPCFLHVDLTGLDAGAIRKVDMILFEEDLPGTVITAEHDIAENELIIPVSKGEVQFCVWGNLFSSEIDSERQLIRTVAECDSIWFFRQSVSTNCEDAYLKVAPERQTRTVTVILRGNLAGISNVSTRLTGIDTDFTFSGDVPAGNPGKIVPILVSTPESGSGIYQFQTTITRQADAFDATLELEFTSDGSVRSGTYEIGKMLFEAGEDLSESSGHPIVIDLVFGNSSVFISLAVDGWTGHDVFEITY